MTIQTHTDLQQLTETVTRLSEALAASERRHSAMAQAIRWGALTFIVLVAATAYAASDMVKAYAANGFTWDQAQKMITGTIPRWSQAGGVQQALPNHAREPVSCTISTRAKSPAT